MNRDSGSALDHGHARQGLALGISAYGLWGVLPIYFKALRSIDAFNIVAHRIVWSVPILAALLSFTGTWGEVREALRNRRAVILLTITVLQDTSTSSAAAARIRFMDQQWPKIRPVPTPGS